MLWNCSYIPVLWLLFSSAAMPQMQALREAARLDSEGRCSESEPYYQKALAAGAPSPALLNNTANHYLVCGQPDKARIFFEQLLLINPAHENANLQMARLAVDEKRAEKALAYLLRVRNSEPAVRLLRAEALHWAGKRQDALASMNALEREAVGDPRNLFAIGAAFARLGMYDRAEKAFADVLVQQPDNFDVLFHLGRAAARTQHFARARSALEAATQSRPADTDALLELGLVCAASKDYNRAVFVLARARQTAPQRADILLALARAAEDAGYYGDSALAYDEYVKLQPADDTARRDRARVLGYTGSRLEEGLKEMAAYIAKKPADPLGYYNLAQFTWRTEPEKSLAQLATAIHLDPGFAPAHVSRAWLLHRLGRSEEAIPHLEAALKITPDNVRALDQLGLVHLSLDRPADAEKALRRAITLDREDPDVLMHLGRALMAMGREEEAQPLLEKYQQTRPNRHRDPRREPGMIESATLPDAERRIREIERFRRLSSARPDDPVLQLHLADLLLAHGRIEEATVEFRRLRTFNADSKTWEEAGRSLVRAEQYALAKDFLELAAQERLGARLDLAVAVLHTTGPAAALQVIEKVPDGEQASEFLLMKARILDAAGEKDQAAKLLAEGLDPSVLKPSIARQAAMLVLRYGRPRQALSIVDRSLTAASGDSDLLLTRAIVLGVMDDSAGAEKQLKGIESRWPEWDRPYLIHGLLLERGNKSEAMQKLRTAVALGSKELAAKCALARLSGAPTPNPTCDCLTGLRQFLFAACDQPLE